MKVPAHDGGSFWRDLYSKLGNENSGAGHIKCSRGSQVPHPCFRQTIFYSLILYNFNSILLSWNFKGIAGRLVAVVIALYQRWTIYSANVSAFIYEALHS